MAPEAYKQGPKATAFLRFVPQRLVFHLAVLATKPILSEIVSSFVKGI